MIGSRNARLIAFFLFIFLFVYLILRAIFLEPLNDELLTLFYYIETGEIIGPKALLDANNHILISLWGRLIFQLGGENFFWFRLPSLLGFVLYFWGLYRIITQRSETISWTLCIAFLGIVSIPYVLEYFAYARGYGISLGCFIWVIIGALKIQGRIKIWNLIVLFLFMLVAISANLSLIILGLLLLFWVQFQQVAFWNQYRPKFHMAIFGICILYVISLFPFMGLSFELREKGLLYYGSLNGLWLETGKSLSGYTFFLNSDVLKWIWILIFIGIILFLLERFLKYKKEYFRNSILIFPWFIFGSLTAMVIMAEIMKVNYPSDRTAIYLIPLVFFLLVLLLEKIKWGKYLNICFGFFLISFILKLNLNSSIFSPEDRLNTKFYKEIRENLSAGMTISGSPVMVFTWPYAERKQEKAILLNLIESAELSDVVVVSVRDKQSINLDHGFEAFASDPKKMLTAYRRLNPVKKTSIQTIKGENKISSEEFIPLFSLNAIDTIRANDLLFEFKGTISSTKQIKKLILVISVDDSLKNVRYTATEMNWYFSKDRHKMTINFPWIMKNKLPNERDIKFYLWNLGENEVLLEDVQIEILQWQRKEKN
jgi:hypothetical protein